MPSGNNLKCVRVRPRGILNSIANLTVSPELLPALLVIHLQRENEFLACVEVRYRSCRGRPPILLSVDSMIDVEIEAEEVKRAITVTAARDYVLGVDVFQVDHRGFHGCFSLVH